MMEISLSNSLLCAIVDDEDYEWLSKSKWRLVTIKPKNKANRIGRYIGRGTSDLMHRVIMKPEKGVYLDHINHNGLDNRRSNLRFCTNSQNCMHMRKRLGEFSSRFKGVSFYKRDGTWEAYLKLNYKRRRMGYFKTEIEAAIAYNEEAKKVFGEFAVLNEIPAI